MSIKRWVITILSLLVFIGCAVYVGSYFYGLKRDSDKMSHIQDIVHAQDPPAADKDQEKEIIEYAENGMIKKYVPAYEMNNDLTGWLRVYGTNIDYPVMYTNNGNDYYLRRGFDKEKNSSGMLFLDYDCNFTDSDNLIVYGHNMRNGTMFAELLKYRSEDFYKNAQYIRFDSLYQKSVYKIIGAMHIKSGSPFKYYEFAKAETPEEFNEYVANVKKLSLYDTGESAEYGDKLLTLSTCSYNTSDERFVVVAKKVE